MAYRTAGLRVDRWSWGIPILLFFAALFAYYSATYGYPLDEDYSYFTVLAGIFAVFYSLAYGGRLGVELAAILALSSSALLIHMVPAVDNSLIGDIDSYWRLKWMEGIYDNGYPTEFDPLTYPLRGGLLHRNDYANYVDYNEGLTFGLTQKNTPMLQYVFYAAVALALRQFGFSLYATAMIIPGVFVVPIVLMMYLLVKEMFYDMRPYNKVAAFASAFMFSLSPILATKVVGTNCEDEAVGMFLMLSTMFLFFAAYHRRSFKYSVFCGLALLMLRMSWGGTTYTTMTLGTFGALYAVVRYIRNRNAIEHLPYIIIPALMYLTMGVFVHARGAMPVFFGLPPLEGYPMMAAVVLPVILEFARVMRRGEIFVDDGTLEGRVVDYVEGKIKPIGTAIIVLFALSLLAYKTPSDWARFVVSVYHMASGVRSVVHQTVSEQNPMAESLGDFFSEGYRQYGLAVYLAVIALPVMADLVYTQSSVGALFLLTWGIPMIYAGANKSSWIFGSSASVMVLAGSVGLFAAVKKSEFKGIRAVATIALLAIPAYYVPMFGLWNYSKFPGYMVMHMGPAEDIYYWEPMLEWHHNNTKQGDAIITWWDYGHWITAIARRPVIADGLQADYYEIQDLARFFMNETDEDKAFEIVKEYDQAYKGYNESWGLNYAAIDWTMIGKGSAMHFIATGNIENVTPGSWKNYVQCGFMPENSKVGGQATVNENGEFTNMKEVFFGCQNGMAIVFDMQDETTISGINVITDYGPIPWSTFSRDQDASLLGVEPLISINGREHIPSILFCALNWDNPRLSICRLPQFNTLVYVPQEFNDYMMTRLYLGKYLNEYRALGLYNRDVKPLKHFREVPDYNRDGTPDGEFSYGFVRSYEISYGGYNISV